MASKPYDEMSMEELDAWYDRHQRWRGLRAFMVLLIVFAIAGAAWFALRAWHDRSEAQLRAEKELQYQELRSIEMQNNAAGADAVPPCTPAVEAPCAAQPKTVVPYAVDTSAPVVPTPQ